MTVKQLQKQINLTARQLRVYEANAIYYKRTLISKLWNNHALILVVMLPIFLGGWKLAKTPTASLWFKHRLKAMLPFLLYSSFNIAFLKPLKLLISRS